MSTSQISKLQEQIQTRDGYQQSFTAAYGPLVKGASPANPTNIDIRQHEWQRRVLKYADVIPEVNAATEFLSNIMRRIDWKVEAHHKVIGEILERQLRTLDASRLAANLFLVGEAILAFKYSAACHGTQWETYSVREIEYKKGKTLRVRSDKFKMEPIDSGMKFFRIYRPDPDCRFSAHSQHKSMLDLLESMYLHQLSDAAIAQSRLAGSGILYIPSDGLTNDPMMTDGRPAPGSIQELMVGIASAMRDSISNRTSYDAFIPYMMTGAAQDAAGLRHVLMDRQDNAYAYNNRIEGQRERYAGGIDLPPEIVLGVTNANHWTARQVDDDMWSYHLLPLAQLIAEALTHNFARPVAANLGINPADVFVVPDGTNVISRPDKTQYVIELIKTGWATPELIAQTGGFDRSLIRDEPLAMQQGQASEIVAEVDPAITAEAAPMLELLAAPVKKKPKTLEQVSAELVAADKRFRERIRATIMAHLKRAGAQQIRDNQTITASVEDDLASLAVAMRTLSTLEIRRRLRIITQNNQVSYDATLLAFSSEITRRADLIAQAGDRYAASVLAAQAIRQITISQAQNIGVVPAAVIENIANIQSGGADILLDNFVELSEKPQNLNTDPIIDTAATEEYGEFVKYYYWDYDVGGHRQNPFPEHEDLADTEWLASEEQDAIGNDDVGFPASVWFPGDHTGCRCQYGIRWEPVEAAAG